MPQLTEPDKKSIVEKQAQGLTKYAGTRTLPSRTVESRSKFRVEEEISSHKSSETRSANMRFKCRRRHKEEWPSILVLQRVRLKKPSTSIRKSSHTAYAKCTNSAKLIKMPVSSFATESFNLVSLGFRVSGSVTNATSTSVKNSAILKTVAIMLTVALIFRSRGTNKPASPRVVSGSTSGLLSAMVDSWCGTGGAELFGNT